MILEFLTALILSTILSGIVEFVSHKYLLHKLGKKKENFFNYHWRHHGRARKCNIDEYVYSRNIFNNLKTKDSWKEIFSLVLIVAFNSIWLFIWPLFFYFTIFWTITYFVLHYASHAFPEWGIKWLPWHYEHHIFDQEANYGVTLPLVDYVMKTRKKYISKWL